MSSEGTSDFDYVFVDLASFKKYPRLWDTFDLLKVLGVRGVDGAFGDVVLGR